MRVIEACVRYPPAKGGAETHVHALATRLKARGHDVTVYTSDLDTEFPMKRLGPEQSSPVVLSGTAGAVEKVPGIGVGSASPPVSSYPSVDGVPVRRFRAHSLPGGMHWVYMPSMKAMYKDRADLIHAHSYGYHQTHIAAKAAERLGVPFVYTPHYHPPYSTTGGAGRKGLRAFYDKALGTKPFRAASLVIAVSSVELEWMRPLIPPTTRTVVIPNGIELKRFEGGGEGRAFREKHQVHGPLLLYTGRLAVNKRLESVVGLMPALLKEFPDLTFVAVGEDHGKRAEWHALAAKLGVEKRVLFLGHVSGEELVEAYRACDAYVLPSDYEAFGIVLLEAMACGKPCVATKVGGVSDIITDRRTGLLVPYGDALALKSALVSLLGDSALRRELGSAARASVGQRFDWDSVVTRTEAEYQALVDSHRRP